MTQIVQPLRSGQITIPAPIRRQLRITDKTVFSIKVEKGSIHITPLEVQEKGKGSVWMKQLYDAFAEVRDEAGSSSEAEINEGIDTAIKAVRKSHR